MSVQDTANPRLKTTISPAELAQIWTATAKERVWVTQVARESVAQFGLLATLKCVQRLGYFVPLADLPRAPSGIIWCRPSNRHAPVINSYGMTTTAPAGAIGLFYATTFT